MVPAHSFALQQRLWLQDIRQYTHQVNSMVPHREVGQMQRSLVPRH